MTDRTSNVYIQDEEHMRQTLTQIYDALCEKGYNPINQIVGYILSGDPTYITAHNNARSLIRKIDCSALMENLVKNYLSVKPDSVKHEISATR